MKPEVPDPAMVDYDRLASEYAAHRSVHPVVLRRLAERGPITRSSTVLEVGCGTGHYLRALRERTGCAAYGVDPSPGMLAKARESGPELRLREGRAERLPPWGPRFDLVFSVDVLHHMVDRPAFFRGAVRAIRPGGMVCTVTDSEWTIRHRSPLVTYFPDVVEPEVRRYPSLRRLRELMREAGLTGIEEELVEFPYEIRDATPYRRKVFSCLSLISDRAFDRGIARMEEDLLRGPLPAVARSVLVWGRLDPTARNAPSAKGRAAALGP